MRAPRKRPEEMAPAEVEERNCKTSKSTKLKKSSKKPDFAMTAPSTPPSYAEQRRTSFGAVTGESEGRVRPFDSLLTEPSNSDGTPPFASRFPRFFSLALHIISRDGAFDTDDLHAAFSRATTPPDDHLRAHQRHSPSDPVIRERVDSKTPKINNRICTFCIRFPGCSFANCMLTARLPKTRRMLPYFAFA